MIGELAQEKSAIDFDLKKKKPIVKTDNDPVKDFQSPPSKRMKQSRLPLMVLSGPQSNGQTPVLQTPVQESLVIKKRKLSDHSTTPVKNKKLSKENLGTSKGKDIKGPVKTSDANQDGKEEEVTSSSGRDDVEILSVEVVSPKPNRKACSLDGFVQRSQEPHSTSPATDFGDRVEDAEADCMEVSLETEEDPPIAVYLVETSNGALDKKEVTEADDSIEENNTTASSVESDALNDTAESKDSSAELDSSTPNSENEKQTKPGRKPKNKEKLLEKEKEKQRLREEKAKLREEKIKKLEAEKAEKEKIKKEALAKKEQEQEEARKQRELKRKEREALKEKEEREREEKRKMKMDMRQKKMELLEAKEEEKKKKLEEKQKLEDEKLRKEEELKKKSEKQKQFFMGFFEKPATPTQTPTKEIETQFCGPFAPFEPKEDMALAPCIRTYKLQEADVREKFDHLTTSQDAEDLYLNEIKKSNYKPGKSERTIRRAKAMEETSENNDDEVQFVSITTSEKAPKMVTVKAKLIQFCENHRPAYFGTWSKRSKVISGRKPFGKDKDILDYDVDSDEEWEDPGESLTDSGTEDEGDSDGEDSDDDGFFVPHGYLSDDEADGAGEDKESWEARRSAKAKDWEREMKKKAEVLKIFQIGCFWEGFTSCSVSSRELSTLTSFKMVPLVALPIRLKEVGEADHSQSEKDAGNSPQGTQLVAVNNKIRPVPDAAMHDLIRLIHGNVIGMQNLINEFRAFWKKKNTEGIKEGETQEASSPNFASIPSKSAAPETATSPAAQKYSIFKSGDYYVISKRQLEKKIAKIAVREKRHEYKTCWYVHDHIRSKYKLMDLSVPNQWEYVTKKLREVAKGKPSDSQSQKSPLVSGVQGKQGSAASDLSRCNDNTTPNQSAKKASLIGMLKKSPAVSPKSPALTAMKSPSLFSPLAVDYSMDSAAAVLQSLAVKTSKEKSSTISPKQHIPNPTLPGLTPPTKKSQVQTLDKIKANEKSPKLQPSTIISTTPSQIHLNPKELPCAGAGYTPVTPKAPQTKSQVLTVRSLKACFAMKSKPSPKDKTKDDEVIIIE